MTRATQTWLVVLTLALGWTAAANAGNVRLQTGGRQAFVDVPFLIAISVTFETDHEAPAIPQIDGAAVEEAGTSRSSNRSVQITINGRQIQSENTVTYQYRLTPKRPGVLRIPRISVVVDGETLQTQATAVQVSEVELGDLMLLELTASKDTVYVGEPVNVTLALWIKPYQQGNLQLDYQQMWSLVQDDVSSWGQFADVLKDKQVTARTARRVNADGTAVTYFVYELEQVIWPQRAGALDIGDVRVIAEYPLMLTRERGTFFMSGGLRISQSKPIAATIGEMPVTVKAIPTEGRPPYYQGAVGEAQIAASAAPTHARVGDPITLNLLITGGGRLETLPAPRLANLPEINTRFQVADDPLPGVIEGRSKRFTQSIRALTEDVTEIPRIPYAYFDPQREQFVTVYSEAIPLEIEAAERMSATQIVDGGGERTGGPERLTRLTRGIEANYTHADALLAQQGFKPTRAIAVAAAAPPFLYMACALGLRRRRRMRQDVSGRRRRLARRTALARLRQRETDVAATAQALLGYVADRFNLPTGGLTRADAVERLRSAGMAEEIVVDADDLLRACEAAEFGGGTANADTLIRRVESLIGRLEKQ